MKIVNGKIITEDVAAKVEAQLSHHGSLVAEKARNLNSLASTANGTSESLPFLVSQPDGSAVLVLPSNVARTEAATVLSRAFNAVWGELPLRWKMVADQLSRATDEPHPFLQEGTPNRSRQTLALNAESNTFGTHGECWEKFSTTKTINDFFEAMVAEVKRFMADQGETRQVLGTVGVADLRNYRVVVATEVGSQCAEIARIRGIDLSDDEDLSNAVFHLEADPFCSRYSVTGSELVLRMLDPAAKDSRLNRCLSLLAEVNKRLNVGR